MGFVYLKLKKKLQLLHNYIQIRVTNVDDFVAAAAAAMPSVVVFDK